MNKEIGGSILCISLDLTSIPDCWKWLIVYSKDIKGKNNEVKFPMWNMLWNDVRQTDIVNVFIGIFG